MECSHSLSVLKAIVNIDLRRTLNVCIDFNNNILRFFYFHKWRVMHMHVAIHYKTWWNVSDTHKNCNDISNAMSNMPWFFNFHGIGFNIKIQNCFKSRHDILYVTQCFEEHLVGINSFWHRITYKIMTCVMCIWTIHTKIMIRLNSYNYCGLWLYIPLKTFSCHVEGAIVIPFHWW